MVFHLSRVRQAAFLLALCIPGVGAAGESEDARTIAPSRGILPSISAEPVPDEGLSGAPADLSVRSIDGSWNNLDAPRMGATSSRLARWFDPDYSDKVDAMAGAARPGARAVSNALNAQSESIVNDAGVTDFFWQWGQFLDHDIDLTSGAAPAEAADIEVPDDDALFPPGSVIRFDRSAWAPETASDPQNPRQQINQVTGWIDASQVYGSDPVRAEALREFDGAGRLRVGGGNLLPWNTEGLPNAGGPGPFLFLAGDVRANEQVGLTALHTLFVREHNRLADLIAGENPDWTGEQVYQRARLLVGATIQVITYEEFLPILLGPNAIPDYRGYRPDVDAGVANVFSTAAYRFGHSALSERLLRLDAEGREIADGHLPLRDAFFQPERISLEGGIEPLLRGLAKQRCQRIDLFVTDAVRNFLFGEPGDGGFDLAALNIQRGRDHGLPSYNDTRRALGLRPAEDFDDVTSDTDIQSRLSALYDDVGDIDLWIGGLAEDPLAGAMLGELFHTIVAKQFTALRDGDRFWYANVLGKKEQAGLRKTTLARIIRMNSVIGSEIQDDVFLVEKTNKKSNK